jgi:RimJ/RimL family protein N-acetyltransferase
MGASESPWLWRQTPTLSGRHVVLRPLASEHTAGLQRARDHEGLHGLWYTNTPTCEGMEAFVAAALKAHVEGHALPFTVLKPDGEIVGTTRLYALEAKLPSLSIGYTWYTPSVQRTGLNTEAKLLLLRHAFQTLGCIRVGFETSVANVRSRAAITRLGAKQEGILRNHKRHADGSPRDTVVYSIIDNEWPEIERGLLEKLNSYEMIDHVH